MTVSPIPAGTDVGDTPGGKFQSRTGIYDAAGNEIGALIASRLASLVAGLAANQPISAASLPLPAGAATAAKQDAAAVLFAAIQAAAEAAQPARQSFAITPSDTAAITPLPRAVRVNGAGTVTYRAVDSTTDVTITAAAGETIPARIQYIRAAGTNASGFVGHA